MVVEGGGEEEGDSAEEEDEEEEESNDPNTANFAVYNPYRENYHLPNFLYPSSHLALGVDLVIDENLLATVFHA